MPSTYPRVYEGGSSYTVDGAPDPLDSNAPITGRQLQDAVTAAVNAAVSTNFDARYARFPSAFEGTIGHVYGTSFDVLPGLGCTAGLEWLNRLKTRLGLAAINSYAVAARWAWQAAFEAIGDAGAFVGLPTFPAGCTWPTTRRGFAIVDTYTNDVSNIYDLSVTAIPNPWSSDGRDLAQRTMMLRVLLSAISAGTRTEVESIGALTGTWATLAGGSFSASAAQYTTTAGDYYEAPITVPAAGYVDLIASTYDQAHSATQASIQVKVDGTVQQTLALADLDYAGFKEQAGTQQISGLFRIRISAAPGAHTIRVTHNGAAGKAMLLDCWLYPAVNPVPVFVKQDHPLVGGLGSAPAYTTGQVATINDNRAAYDAAVAAVLTEYPNAYLIPYTGDFDPASMASANDGVHPNDLGMLEITDEYDFALAAWADANPLPSLKLFTTI